MSDLLLVMIFESEEKGDGIRKIIRNTGFEHEGIDRTRDREMRITVRGETKHWNRLAENLMDDYVIDTYFWREP